MSQIEVLHPNSTHHHRHTLCVVADDHILSQQQSQLDFFPDLPPLLTGHPSLHLRQGIISANTSPDTESPFPQDPTASLTQEQLASGHGHGEGAFFVCDLSAVYQQHARWMKALPGVRPFYAVKCNPDPYVLRLLASVGCGFDCASNGEISQVLSLNSSSSAINPATSVIFANPCKPTSFIHSSRRAGVQLMTFDNSDELYKIRKSYPQAKLVLRILTDSSKALCSLSLKFGAAMDAVPGLLRLARSLDLSVVGVSFHVGSGCYDPSVYNAAIRSAREVFDLAALPENGGFSMDLLDIGGGFENESFEEAAGVVNTALKEFFPESIMKEGETWLDHIDDTNQRVKVIAEPGRFYVSRAFKLAACVIARRGPSPTSEDSAIQDEGDKDRDVKPKVMYYINDGVYGAFNCILFDHQVVNPYVLSLGGSFHVPSSSSEGGSVSSKMASGMALLPCSVWGPTCDSIDLICSLTYLPSTLAVGDWLGFDNMGAYTVCAASRFNGFEVSRVVYTVGEVGKDPNLADEVLKALGKWAGVSQA